MADGGNGKSGWEKLSEYALPLIAAVIGSSLLVSIITMVASEVNKPIVHIYVGQHSSLQSDPKNDPINNYYEIIARNEGRTPATNLKISMFFFANMTDKPNKPQILLNSSNVVLIYHINETNTSTLKMEANNLSQNEVLVLRVWYDWTDKSKSDPYYISATYKEGSAQYPVFRPVDIESGRLPNISIGSNENVIIEQILVGSSIICIIAFTTAVIHKKLKSRYQDPKLNRSFQTFAPPLIILSAIFIFYCCESLPRSLLIPSIIPVPLDVTTGPSIFDQAGKYGGITYFQGELLIDAGLFVIISTIARTIISYLLAKKIIARLASSPTNYRRYRHIRNKTLFLYSLLIMGPPLSSIFILFFSQSLYSSSIVYFFTIFLMIDIIRMLVLVYVTPRIKLEYYDISHYILGSITVLGAAINFVFFALLSKIIRGDPGITHLINSISFGYKFDFHPFEYAMYFAMFSGLLQLIRLAIPLSKKRHNYYRIPAMMLSGSLIVLWMIIIYKVTTGHHAILNFGLPIISIGIVIIILEFAYLGVTVITRKLPDRFDKPKYHLSPV